MALEKISDLAEKADLLYRLGCVLSENSMTAKDYGMGEAVSMAEAHVLKDIEEHPGITITKLAKEWKRTKGAISQTVTKLEAKRLVEKKKSEKNSRIQLLYVTEKGEKFCKVHRIYDENDMLEIIRKVEKYHSKEEIETYFAVMKTWKENA